jgi:ferredoxin
MPGSSWKLEGADLDQLLELLQDDGRHLIGPTVRDGAIVYERIRGAGDLPSGWTDEQAPGRYRLARRDDAALFGYAVGPHSWKKYLFPPEVRLWSARRGEDGGFSVDLEPAPTARYAFLGVRPCELAAIGIQDKVFLQGPFPDPVYEARRSDVLLIAVHCGVPAGTCFCTSMNTGPRAAADAGYDLALTEVLSGDEHWFLIEAGSPRGEELVAQLALPPAGEPEQDAAQQVTDAAAEQMGLSLQTDRLPEALRASPDHPRWNEVAARCLTCANCTMACPTCFCSDVEDMTDLTGDHAERWRRWDSCFSLDFTYMHGGSVRTSAVSRYRQWLTHKLSTWHDQFGSSGCVGCGRCVTWCPAGIDITEEASVIRSAYLAAEDADEDDR